MNSKSFNLNSMRNYFERHLAIYTVAFFVVYLVVYSSFIIYGKNMIWVDDGLQQHYSALAYYGQWLRSIVVELFTNHKISPDLWNFNIGLGSDVITNFHYYALGDPLCLLSALVPVKYTEYLYGFLIILRMYLAGLSFMFYCKKMKQNTLYSVFGALIYIFCYFGMDGGVRHPFFITPMIYFPLILIGIEKILFKESPFVFIISICFVTMSNFYFAYMVIIMVAIYTAVRFLMMNHKSFFKELVQDVFKVVSAGALGLMMAAVVLLPIIVTYMSNSRAETHNSVGILYSFSYYEKLYADFLGASFIKKWTTTGYSPFSLIAVFFMFSKKKKYTIFKVFFVILMVMQCLPVFGYVMNGFAYVCNRYLWSFSFLMAFLVVYTLEDIVFSSWEEKRKILLCCMVYALSLILLRNGKSFSGMYQIIILLMMALFVTLGVNLFNENKLKNTKIALMLLCVLSIFVNSIQCFYPLYGNEISVFGNSGTALDYYMNTESKAFESDLKETSFFRYDKEENTSINQSILTKTNGISYYWSLNGDNTARFIQEQQINAMTGYFYNNFNQRTFLNTLSGVRYYIAKGEISYVPYGYKFIKNTDLAGVKYSLYENEEALPIGYTYDAYISREEYEELSAVQKQSAIMQNVLLESKIDYFKSNTYQLTDKEIPVEVIPSANVVIKDNGVYVKSAGSGIRLNFEGVKNSETYVVFNGLKVTYMDQYTLAKELSEAGYDVASPSKMTEFSRAYNHVYNGYDSWYKISVDGNVKNSTLTLTTPDYSFNNGFTDFSVNIGYSEQAQSYADVKFPATGYYSWDDIKVVCQPMDGYKEYTSNLSRDVLENVCIGKNCVSGKINLEKTKILCLSIPYSKGWTAYVDGQETDLMVANTWCIGLALDEGEHDIELRYETPGLKIGMISSITSTSFYLGWVVLYAIKKNKKKL